MSAARFTTTLVLGGKTATGIEVPGEVVTTLGAGKRPAVRVTINGHAYRSTVAPMGGTFMLPVSAEIRAAAGLLAGDEVDVTLELDTEARAVNVPADLQVALASNQAATDRFASLSYSNQRRHVLSIEGAKTIETRQRRIAKTIEALVAETT